ncbi:hypothetical protein ATF69_0980 [Acidovorax delafieldii]|uniref:NHL repeat-containing protein n=1 Tax=Acidovorax delafieldii TaxID=47920 RepID=A0A561XSN8_ACIDE|nr:hypothetical protein [Acidovorax delafieldii]TWG39112.1 hypothetical protein ATF69_0980 [Acidovorax delafieldii]
MTPLLQQRPPSRAWLTFLLGASVLATSCGSGSDPETAAPPPAAQASLSLLAGTTSGSGYLDGLAADALFAGPPALALSPAGDLLMADTGNHAIRKLTASGIVSTVAGDKSPEPSPSIQGQYADGPGTAARFYYPSAIVSDAAGNTYIADTANHLVRKIDNTGAVSTFAGKPGVCGNTDGTPQNSTVCAPQVLKLDIAGNLYVGQGSYTYPKIRRITPAGLMSTLGAALPIPERSSFAVDTSGTIYVTDGSSIKKYAPTGELTHVSGDTDIQGTTDGDATTARFGILKDLAIDAANELYALDGLGSATIRHIAKNGTASTVATTAPGALGGTSLVIDRNGDFIASLSNGLSTWIQKYQRDGARTILAGKPTPPDIEGPPPDGPGVDARFRAPLALALAKSGSLYVSGGYDVSRIRIVNPDGVTKTRALQWPAHPEDPSWRAMAVDGQDNIYVASTTSKRESPHLIYRFNPAGQGAVLADVSTWIAPFVSGGRTYSYFAGINGIAADDAGNVYATGVNGVVLKITAAGSVSVLAGSPGTLGHVDGPGGNARFAILGNMALDRGGNLYVVDGLNDAFTGIGPTIRKITPAGMVSTVAGRADLPAGLEDGPATNARFAVASYGSYTAGGVYLGQDFGSSHGENGATASLTVDARGHLYLTDPVNSVIRKISAEGQVTTLVGQAGQRGFVGGDLPGVVHTPVGIAVRDSKLYFTTRNAVAQVSLPQ